MSPATVLIGGTGFLGSHVAKLLVAEEDLAVLVRPTSDLSILPAPASLRETRIEVRYGDLDYPEALRPALEGVTTLVYCASMGFGHIPPLMHVLQGTDVKRAVFLSTTAIFTSLPARSRAVRLAAESAVQTSGLEWTILRPTMIYGGARDRNIARLLRLLRRTPVYPIFGDGRALHQPIYEADLADAVVRALRSPATVREAYNLAGAAPLSYVELVRETGRAVGRAPRLVHLPLGLALAAARVAAALPLPRLVSPEQIRRLAEDKAYDYTSAARDFSFRTRTFADGVRAQAREMGLAPPTIIAPCEAG